MIRITTPDAGAAKALVQVLAGTVSAEDVSLDPHNHQVCVANGEQAQSIVAVLGAIERWLEVAGVDSAEVQMDERHYTMESPDRIGVRS